MIECDGLRYSRDEGFEANQEAYPFNDPRPNPSYETLDAL